jgi:DNA-binding transcriptional MerR regulator
METRVLTLFDDEDFFSREETPQKAPKKTAAAKEKITDAPEEAVEAPLFAAEPSPLAETAIEPIGQENTNIAPADHKATIPNAQETEPAAPEEEIPQESSPAPDDELGRQMLQELIQQDYAALIHKEYPFDIQQASVVQKDKEVKVPAARQETAPAIAEATEEEEETEVFEEVVPLKEWNLDKKYYTIGEVAQLFAVNTSHIRFWTNEFKLKPRTTRKGDRLYSPKDIAELRLIHHLVKEKKHTIKGAREKLKAEKTGVNHKLDLKESLTGLRDMLVQIKEQL